MPGSSGRAGGDEAIRRGTEAAGGLAQSGVLGYSRATVRQVVRPRGLVGDNRSNVSIDLAPLPYHAAVASRLEALEPRAWRLFADAVRAETRAPAPAGGTVSVEVSDGTVRARVDEDDLEQQLLRHAYRMEVDAHPRVHAAARRAADALAIDVPIVIYQLEGREGANAALFFRRHEAVLALSGNILALLDDDELAACFGHELAHHRLWSADDGRILIADRLLSALSLDAATPAAYLETTRRFDLATELYADRGSLLGAGTLDTAISSLVKVATGLTDVDPAAFLRQAEAARPDRGAAGVTHPETVLRAWALARWQAGTGDEAAATLLATSIDIERLDLMDRERLETLTRRMVLDALAVDWMRTEAVVGHARQFMVETTPTHGRSRDWRGRPRHPDVGVMAPPVEVRVDDDVPAETRQFLAYVLLDLATVDPDLEDEPLVEMAAVAREAGIGAMFEEVARRELTLNARAWEGLKKRSLDRRTAPVSVEVPVVPSLDPAPSDPPA